MSVGKIIWSFSFIADRCQRSHPSPPSHVLFHWITWFFLRRCALLRKTGWYRCLKRVCGGGGNCWSCTRQNPFISLLCSKQNCHWKWGVGFLSSSVCLAYSELWFQLFMKEPYVWRMILAGAELGASRPYFHFSLLLGPIYYVRALFYWPTKHRLFFWLCVQGINFYLEVKTITSLWRDEDAEALKAPTAFPTMK